MRGNRKAAGPRQARGGNLDSQKRRFHRAEVKPQRQTENLNEGTDKGGSRSQGRWRFIDSRLESKEGGGEKVWDMIRNAERGGKSPSNRSRRSPTFLGMSSTLGDPYLEGVKEDKVLGRETPRNKGEKGHKGGSEKPGLLYGNKKSPAHIEKEKSVRRCKEPEARG